AIGCEHDPFRGRTRSQFFDSPIQARKGKLMKDLWPEYHRLRPAILNKGQKATRSSDDFDRPSGELLRQIIQFDGASHFQSERNERLSAEAMTFGVHSISARLWRCRVHVRRICLKTSLIRTATVACNLILSQRESESPRIVGNQLLS